MLALWYCRLHPIVNYRMWSFIGVVRATMKAMIPQIIWAVLMREVMENGTNVNVNAAIKLSYKTDMCYCSCRFLKRYSAGLTFRSHNCSANPKDYQWGGKTKAMELNYRKRNGHLVTFASFDNFLQWESKRQLITWSISKHGCLSKSAFWLIWQAIHRILDFGETISHRQA